MPDSSEQLFAAAAAGDADQVRAILEQSPELRDVTDAVGKNALHLAAEFDNVDVARLMLELGSPLDAETDWGATPLQWAGTLGSTNVGRLLLDAGAVPTLYDAAGLGPARPRARFLRGRRTACGRGRAGSRTASRRLVGEETSRN